MTSELNLWVNQLDTLINEGQYARLGKILLDLQKAVKQKNQPDLNNLIATALQICMFCQQCQTEIEWHRKANLDVQQRLVELQEQLDTLIDLINEYETHINTQQPEVSVSVTLLEDRIKPVGKVHTSFWQRIRNLFNDEPTNLNPEQQRSKVAVDVKVISTTKKVEHRSCMDHVDKEITTPPIVEYKPADRMMTDDENMLPFCEWLETTKPFTTLIDAVRDESQMESFTALQLGETGSISEKPPSLMVHCLGPYRVYQNDQLITEWQSGKGKAIFKYLVTHHDRPIAKEILMEIFWPDVSPDAARNNLNVAIYGLRQALRESYPSFSHILYRDETYMINPEINIWLDSEWFLQQISLAQSKEQAGDLIGAIELYNNAEALWLGEFLEEDRYESWPVAQRQLLTEQYLNLLDRLSRYYFDEGNYRVCTTFCRKMLCVDTCREEAHRMMMLCFHLQEQPYLALRQYQQCDEALKTELEVAPSSATKELYQLIRSQISN